MLHVCSCFADPHLGVWQMRWGSERHCSGPRLHLLLLLLLVLVLAQEVEHCCFILVLWVHRASWCSSLKVAQRFGVVVVQHGRLASRGWLMAEGSRWSGTMTHHWVPTRLHVCPWSIGFWGALTGMLAGHQEGLGILEVGRVERGAIWLFLAKRTTS